MFEGETENRQIENEEGKKRKREEAELSYDDESQDETKCTLSVSSKWKNESISGDDDKPVQDINSLKVEALQQETSSEEVTENTTSNFTCKKCKEKNKNFEILIAQNHMICAMMTQIMNEIASLKQQLRNEDCDGKFSSLPKSIFSRHPGLKFPLNTEEDIEQFENILKIEENFVDAVNELANFGGESNYSFVKRSLTVVLTNELAIKYSWLGRKGKKPFYNLTLAKLIVYAAERGKIAKSRKETETSIQLWLKRASDRLANTPKRT